MSALPPADRDPALQHLLETIDGDPSGVLHGLDLEISPELTRLLERGLIGPSLPAVLKDSKAAKAFQQAFDMIGGVPRLALWADKNLSKFYALYGKMLNAQQLEVKKDVTVTINWASPERLSYARDTGPVEDARIVGGNGHGGP